MRRKCQEGAILIVALAMLLIFMVIAALIAGISSLEARMTAFDYSWQQAQQAADGGIEELRMTLLRGMVQGLSPAEILGESYPGWNSGQPWITELDEHTRAQVAWPDLTDYETQGSIGLKVLGIAGSARQDVSVNLNYNHTTGFVLCAGRLKVSGHFKEAAGAPDGSNVWVPEDEIISGENRLAFKQGVPSAINETQLHYLPAAEGQPGPPPTTVYPEQFLTDYIRQHAFSLPCLSPCLDAKWLATAEADPLRWQVWPAGAAADSGFASQFNYMYGSRGQGAAVYIVSEAEDWLRFSRQLAGPSWWQQGWGEDNYPLLVIYSPHGLRVTLDGNGFMSYPGYLLLVTPGDIEMVCQERDGIQQLRLLAVAGRNLHLISQVRDLEVTGSLNARDEIHLEWGAESGCEAGRRIILRSLPDALGYFPYAWSLLGLGTVTAYTSEN